MDLTCRGDLSQLATQKEVLSKGFDYYMSDVYPVVREASVKNFLYFMYNQNIEGWWHYRDVFVEYNICTAEEFIEKLRYVVKSRR